MNNLILSVFGAATSLATAYVLFLVQKYTGLSLYTFSLWFVIPLGAMIAGALASCGYFFGAKLTHQRPTWVLCVNMLVVSTVTFFVVHYLSYADLAVEGRPASEILTFPEYLDLVIRSSSLQEFRTRAETGELGRWGYGLAVLEVMGFALGGLAVYAHLDMLPYCQGCSRYLTSLGQHQRYTSDDAGFVSLYQTLHDLVAAERLPDAVSFHAGFGRSKPDPSCTLRSTLEVKKCRGCGCRWVHFEAAKRSDSGWHPICDLEFSRFTNLPASSEPLVELTQAGS
jgi:hypothetical protein